MQRSQLVHLIAGLGNPGKAYRDTRHNIGFQVVEEIARRHGLQLRKKFLQKGRLARGTVSGQEVILLEPETYMNLSGEAVVRAMRKHRIELSRLLVIVDDVALPLGQLRMRSQSGSGGHNGLKSIEAALGTNNYARLRVGVGNRAEGDLANYVLADFTPEEKVLLPSILERAAKAAEIWLSEGLTSAMNHANANS